MKKKYPLAAIGASSLLTVFSVLCLVVFALLSISTVHSQQNLSRFSAQAVADYYAAECRAEETLALLRVGEMPDGVSESDGVYEYACPISETQTLRVAVRLSGGRSEIVRWQAVSAAEWKNDESLDVWSGE